MRFRHRLGVAAVFVAVATSGKVCAETWALADDATIRERVAAYVRDKHAPGAVVGVLELDAEPARRMRFFSAGRSGRDEVALGPDTLFELGSITKAFTGLLLAERVTSGDVTLAARLGSVAAPAGPPVPEAIAGITLEQLATHRSGLPRLAMHPRDLLPVVLSRDPYAGTTVAGVFVSAARTPMRGAPGGFAYSNLGYALLGQALALQAGRPFEELLRERVLEPHGLGGAVLSPDAAPAGRLPRGYQGNHWPAPHWHLDAYAPAGALVGSARGLLAFFERAIERPWPAWELAAAARHPVDQTGRRHVGLGWMLRRGDNGTLVWHNGGTGGFRTFAGVVAERRVAVVVLTNGSGNADGLALSLIERGQGAVPPRKTPWLGLAMSFLGVLLAPAMVAGAVRAGRVPVRRAADRLDAIHAIAGAAFLLAVSRMSGAWHVVPALAWWVAAVATVLLAAWLVASRLRARPWVTGGRWSRLGRTAMALLLAGLAVLVAGK